MLPSLRAVIVRYATILVLPVAETGTSAFCTTLPSGGPLSSTDSAAAGVPAGVPAHGSRPLRRYYETVRLLGDVHAGRWLGAFSDRPLGETLAAGNHRGLPVSAMRVSIHAQGL